MFHRPHVRREAALVLALLITVALALALLPQRAEAGRYIVAQCDPANRGFADASFERRNGGDYGFAHRCEEDEDASSLQIHTITAAPQNHFGRISWIAPEGSRIVGLGLEARLRSDSGQQARLSFLDRNGSEAARVATGSADAGGFERYERDLTSGGRERFAASLVCVLRAGCEATDRARTWIRSVRLTIDDRNAPTVALSGGLFATGWHRGNVGLAAAASDAGSGVRRIEIGVGAKRIRPTATFPCSLVPGSSLATRMRPCPSHRRVSGAADTRSAPFVNGINRVSVCARDYGVDGSPSCVERYVAVDNAPPTVGFSASERRDDPELIRAPVGDRHSGVGSGTIAYRPVHGGSWRELPTALVDGELRARVDSAAEPRGRYLFRAVAADVAGNTASSSSRRGGERMVLAFPLREETDVDASIDGSDRVTVDYGKRPDVDGTLRGKGGRAVGGEPIAVIERFEAGSSLEPIVHSTRSDAHGRFSVRVARGPSRRIAVRYEGSRRYLPSHADPIRLGVRGSARMTVSARHVHAGRRVKFAGTVGSFGARVPAAGKLVELQVRGGGVKRFRTVREAFRTDGRGRWRMSYGFDRFYDSPTRFRFRLKVTPENRWPYLEPAHSATRALTVLPR
jgi:hypothetical protein